MTLRIVPVHNEAIPEEWARSGRADGKLVMAWANDPKPGKAEKKRSKYGQQAGYYADLDMHLKSKLEANSLRLLCFLGYQIWREKGLEPPPDDLWVGYEWRKYRLTYKAGKPDERPLFYLPDWHLWDSGVMTVWESKGEMNDRSKRLLGLFEEQVMPVVLITAPRLNERRTVALYAARRQGTMVLEIPHWNEGPIEKGERK